MAVSESDLLLIARELIRLLLIDIPNADNEDVKEILHFRFEHGVSIRVAANKFLNDTEYLDPANTKPTEE